MPGGPLPGMALSQANQPHQMSAPTPHRPKPTPDLRAEPRPRPRRIGPFLQRELLWPMLACVLLTVMAAIGLYSAADLDQAPFLAYALPLLAALMYFASRAARSWPTLRALRAATRQNKLIGKELDLSAKAAGRAFHVVDGIGFDLDHVLIVPAGVFAIVDELHPPLAGSEAHALFDGEFLELHGAVPMREPIARARVLARGLGGLLSERLNRAQRVTPVLLLPGWSVQQPSPLRPDTCVASPAQFIAYLAGLPTALDRDELFQISEAMAEILRDARRRKSTHQGARPVAR